MFNKSNDGKEVWPAGGRKYFAFEAIFRGKIYLGNRVILSNTI